MFCPNCGKELPDGAKFCAHCGKAVRTTYIESTSNNSGVTEPVPEILQISETAKGHPQREILRPRNIIMLVAVVCIISIVAISAVRASNKRALKDMTVDTLYRVFQYEITAHYDPLMPKPVYENGYEITYDKSAFKMVASSEPNSFVLTGNFIARDLVSDGNPEYIVSIKSDVKSDFMRKLCSCGNWAVEYEDPEFIVPTIDIGLGVDIGFFNFCGTYASIYDSTNILEVDGDSTSIVLTGFNDDTTLFHAGITLAEFMSSTPRNRVHYSDKT